MEACSSMKSLRGGLGDGCNGGDVFCLTCRLGHCRLHAGCSSRAVDQKDGACHRAPPIGITCKVRVTVAAELHVYSECLVPVLPAVLARLRDEPGKLTDRMSDVRPRARAQVQQSSNELSIWHSDVKHVACPVGARA
eukprot:352735-Chlamydomonas_euryale.AAC.1